MRSLHTAPCKATSAAAFTASIRPPPRLVSTASSSAEKFAASAAQMSADPEMQKKLAAVQEAMKKPEVQQQMAQMQAAMGNQQMQARMQQLRSDPEFAGFFEELKTGGMQALMKYYNDPAFLAKLSSKVGDVPMPGISGPPRAAGAAAAPAMELPEVKNLHEAARYGDIEAVEDFIAIGKDVGMQDKEGRTPLHFAAGYNHADIAKMLISEGAPLESTDSKGNTALHYAAGYGRAELVELLLEAGANKTAVNSNGSTPHALATSDARNPLSQNEAVLAKLKL